MPIMKSTDGSISARTSVFAERTMLRHAEPVHVFNKFGARKEMPRNKGTTIKFRRPKPFAAATTPLVEGVTPNLVNFEYEDVTGTLKQYGMVAGITDVIEDTHEDPVLKDMSEQVGENLGRTMESLTYGIVRAGTNVAYANGTLRTAVNTPISLGKQRLVTRALKAQKAQKITSMLGSGTGVGTRPVEAAFIAIAHTDLESDIRNLPGFKSTSEYGSRSVIVPEEIGSVEDVRYILSPDLEPFRDAGGAKGAMVSTTGTSADVYPIIYLGKDTYGTVPLRGEGAVAPTIIPVGTQTKDDPLAQRGYVGWKSWFLALILNQAWMMRLEVSVTAL